MNAILPPAAVTLAYQDLVEQYAGNHHRLKLSGPELRTVLVANPQILCGFDPSPLVIGDALADIDSSSTKRNDKGVKTLAALFIDQVVPAIYEQLRNDVASQRKRNAELLSFASVAELNADSLNDAAAVRL